MTDPILAPDLDTHCSRCGKSITVYSGDVTDAGVYSCATCVTAFGPLSL